MTNPLSRIYSPIYSVVIVLFLTFLAACYEFNSPLSPFIQENIDAASDGGNGGGNAFHTVTFNSNGGSHVAPQTVAHGATVAYPDEPTKTGEFFDGWYADAACTNPYIYGTHVTGNITLYAKWLTESAMIAGELGGPPNLTFTVYDLSTWNTACTAISGGGNDKNYVIHVTGSFSPAGVTTSNFGTTTGIKVLIYSDGTKTISLSSNGSLLRIETTQTLVLRNITLVGKTANSSSLVFCSGAGSTLFMRPGVVVKDNIRNTGSGGGVTVNSSGAFTMNGGTISGNTASTSGGGVYVITSTFTMNGGAISGNTASTDQGGGVFVGSSTLFTMNGGAINGNTATAGNGGGVYNYYGTFTMSGGAISDNHATAGNGGGVYVGAGTATFTMSGGIVYGNEAENGALKNTAGTGAALNNAGTANWGSTTIGVVGGVTNVSPGGSITTTDSTLSTQ